MAEIRKRAALYFRVSTAKQDEGIQRMQMKEHAERMNWNVTEYIDHGVSGAKKQRLALDQLEEDVRAGRVDVVAVVCLDRLGRNLQHLLDLIGMFEDHDVEFVSLREGVDSRTPTGRLMVSLIGAIAEFELSRKRERMSAWRAKRQEDGLPIGPTRKYEFDVAVAIERLNGGESAKTLAREIGCSPSLIYLRIKQSGLPFEKAPVTPERVNGRFLSRAESARRKALKDQGIAEADL